MTDQPPPIQLALKVDVDTCVGYQQGIPNLLAIFAEFEIPATFYVAAGPDNSGKALRRIFLQQGFLKKMIRNRAPSAFGLRTVLSGTLLPAPMICASDPKRLHEIRAAGHALGVHGYDHVQWHDFLGKMSLDVVRKHVLRGFDTLAGILGERPRTFASPGWQCSEASLVVEDELQLDYASDTRGTVPFLPRIGEKTFATPQIPTTLPTLDEIMGLTADKDYPRQLGEMLTPGLNVFTLHTEMEGMGCQALFREFLTRAKEAGAAFVTLESVAEEIRQGSRSIAPAAIAAAQLPGRAGVVWCQEGFVAG